MNLKRLIGGALALLFVGNALAWDEGGHILIGEIAARRLRPEVAAEMKPLIALLDPQFNGGAPYNLVTVGVWLDDQRGLGQANPWSRWHFIDFECDAGKNPPEPPPPHALWGLDQATAVLGNRQARPQDRAVALAQVIHIVGDIHQPVHAADRHDRGGNTVAIAPLFDGPWSPRNLHAFWDSVYRIDVQENRPVELWRLPARPAWPEAPGVPGVISREAAAALEWASANVRRVDGAAASGTRPWEAWARETYAMACEKAWPPGGGTLSPAFIHGAHFLAMAQIVKAGERLGDLLNARLAPPAREGAAAAPAAPAAAGR
ncbi:MAG: S1/P1 nuclease [Chthoniobacteraceae bacterium]